MQPSASLRSHTWLVSEASFRVQCSPLRLPNALAILDLIVGPPTVACRGSSEALAQATAGRDLGLGIVPQIGNALELRMQDVQKDVAQGYFVHPSPFNGATVGCSSHCPYSRMPDGIHLSVDSDLNAFGTLQPGQPCDPAA